MKIVNMYSFKNGENFIKDKHKKEFEDVLRSIEILDATSCLTKESKEKTMKGKLLFSPRDMNDFIKTYLHERDWTKKADGKRKK